MGDFSLDDYMLQFDNKDELVIYSGDVDTKLCKKEDIQNLSWIFNFNTKTFMNTNFKTENCEELKLYGNILEFSGEFINCELRFYKDRNVDHELYYKGFEEDKERTKFSFKIEDNKLISEIKGTKDIYFKQ